MIDSDTCPTDQDLRLLIEGSITERESEALTVHLDRCESCRIRLDRLAGGGGSWALFRALTDRHEAGPPPNPWAITEELRNRRNRQIEERSEEDEPTPASIGPYQILGLLGRGAMGRVHKAYDPSLRRVVAVKVMAAEWSGDKTAKRRFLREARAAAAICHEHVVLVHAVEEGDPVPYIVMQLVPGQSLQERLADRGRLGLREIIQIGKQTAAGLAAAHAQGIVHRDVKPANILLEQGVERVKITDFGLARAVDDARLSKSGQFAGTPLYASPEQAFGEDVDPRSDLFSLGAVLYELCTGAPAFDAPTPMAVLKRICEDDPRPIRSLNPNIPEWLCAVIDKLLAKVASERFASAADVAELLEQYLAYLNQPAAFPHPPSVPRSGRRRARWRWLAAGGVLLALVTTAVLLIRTLTNQGELVIEADGDAAEVIAKHGGVTIKDVKKGHSYTVGPGRHRLDSGDYKIEATGPNSRLTFATTRFTISRGESWLIRVTITPRPQRSGAVFAVLPHGSDDEMGFQTLNEAISASPAGATVEVRSDGPFDLIPVTLTRPLRIRAAPGRTPVIRMIPDGWKVTSRLITTTASLTLEGLEFQRSGAPPDATFEGFLTVTDYTGTAEVRVANCRFKYAKKEGFLFEITGAALVEFRDSAFFGETPGAWAVAVDSMQGGEVVIEGCVFAGYGLSLGRTAAFPARAVDVRLRRNTWLVTEGVEAPLGLNQFDTSPGPLPAEPPYRIRAVENVFASRGLMVASWQRPGAQPGPHSPAELEAAYTRLVRWEGARNVFATGVEFLGTFSWPAGAAFTRSRKKLESWTALPNVREANPAMAPLLFVGGDAFNKHAQGSLVEGDFELASPEAKGRGRTRRGSVQGRPTRRFDNQPCTARGSGRPGSPQSCCVRGAGHSRSAWPARNRAMRRSARRVRRPQPADPWRSTATGRFTSCPSS